MLTAFRLWPARRWTAALLGSVLVTVLLAIPADLIDTPIFGRAIEPEWWSWPVTIVTGILGGFLLATYVGAPPAPESSKDSAGRAGAIAGVVSFFAIGCPVCNKLVLIALGTTGAMQWFAPLQPILAVGAIVLLAWALRRRLLGELSCEVAASG